MFTDAGHMVYVYAGATTDTAGEHVPVVTASERKGWFGAWDPDRMPDVGWAATDPWWRVFCGRTVVELQKRFEPGDLLLLSTSWAQKPVVDAFPELMAVEYGVGYEGIMLDRCAFESYSWMHHVYGLKGIKDGRNYDAVIPNYFDRAEFPSVNIGGDYLLFLGRVTPRKGVEEALEIAKAFGMRLVVAGPRQAQNPADEVALKGCEYVGPVGIRERAELLAGAHATVCMTRFLEPFGGVAVEALMTGCPVISTDWGAFPETIQPGTGFRCRTLQEAVDAVEGCYSLDRAAIREYAFSKYSLEAVGSLYDAWFGRLRGLYGKGWYERRMDAA
jgi:glycosyltransferase involved in cell wall biosynthesis